MQRGSFWAISTITGIASLGVGPAKTAEAGTFVRSGIEFCEVRAPGNRAPTEAEMPNLPGLRRPGSVGYEYAIAKTELTAGEYLGFLQAYAKFYPVNPFDGGVTGDYIFGENTPSGLRLDLVNPVVARRPTSMSWRMAATYCNWLHNDRAMTREAFESGAYDTRTFGKDSNGRFTDQIVRSPGARFWIPNHDEWIKATFFDPNRYGMDAAGYWPFAGSSDAPLRAGDPLLGGQTNAGDAPPGQWKQLDVGSYPNFSSPWGLLDTSGGTSEWLDGSIQANSTGLGVDFAGSKWTNIDLQAQYYDSLGVFSSGFPMFDSAGLRIATVIPMPATSVCLAFGLCAFSRRNRI